MDFAEACISGFVSGYRFLNSQLDNSELRNKAHSNYSDYLRYCNHALGRHKGGQKHANPLDTLAFSGLAPVLDCFNRVLKRPIWRKMVSSLMPSQIKCIRILPIQSSKAFKMKNTLLFFSLSIFFSGNHAFAEDTVQYNEKRKLVCTVVSQEPELSDVKVGDIKTGWLRIQNDMFYSIESAGYVFAQYAANNSATVMNSKKSLYIKDFGGDVLLNKATGRLTFQIFPNDGVNYPGSKRQLDCIIGEHLPNNIEM